eukprot:5490040-Prymnesium_polylepis.2
MPYVLPRDEDVAWQHRDVAPNLLDGVPVVTDAPLLHLLALIPTVLPPASSQPSTVVYRFVVAVDAEPRRLPRRERCPTPHLCDTHPVARARDVECASSRGIVSAARVRIAAMGWHAQSAGIELA